MWIAVSNRLWRGKRRKLGIKEESVELGHDSNQTSSSAYTEPFRATSPVEEAREDADRGSNRIGMANGQNSGRSEGKQPASGTAYLPWKTMAMQQILGLLDSLAYPRREDRATSVDIALEERRHFSNVWL
ncbi:hypothetical protein BJ742DRAFT_736889 [Cladochytrium replicatum]|nr:hypothetical protein BJ742DRAFT_736889 [Cladochytrium replicatum]